MTQRARYALNAATTTAVTVVPSARAFATAATHTSSGMRNERGMVATSATEGDALGVADARAFAHESGRLEGLDRHRVRVALAAPVALDVLAEDSLDVLASGAGGAHGGAPSSVCVSTVNTTPYLHVNPSRQGVSMTDLTPCQEHVHMLRTSGLFAAGARSLWDTDTDKPDAAQRQAIADAKAGCVDCPAFDACRLELDARMRDGEDIVGIVAGTDRRDRDALNVPRVRRITDEGKRLRRERAIARMQHGTRSGYRAHYGLEVMPVCGACRDANREHMQARREASA